MEKNLSIIQGLTSTDQANPIRITDAGEVKIAASTSIPVSVSFPIINPGDPADANTGINVPMGITEDNKFQRLELIDNNTYLSGVTNNVQKLLVDQAKSFSLYETYCVDTTSLNTEGDYISWIDGTIAQWVTNHGLRYDDMKINTTNNGVGGKTFLTITIIRYYY